MPGAGAEDCDEELGNAEMLASTAGRRIVSRPITRPDVLLTPHAPSPGGLRPRSLLDRGGARRPRQSPDRIGYRRRAQSVEPLRQPIWANDTRAPRSARRESRLRQAIVPARE